MASMDHSADTFRPKVVVAVGSVLQIQLKKAFRRVVMALSEPLCPTPLLGAQHAMSAKALSLLTAV